MGISNLDVFQGPDGAVFPHDIDNDVRDVFIENVRRRNAKVFQKLRHFSSLGSVEACRYDDAGVNVELVIVVDF
jgi:hypothetical protein